MVNRPTKTTVLGGGVRGATDHLHVVADYPGQAHRPRYATLARAPRQDRRHFHGSDRRSPPVEREQPGAGELDGPPSLLGRPAACCCRSTSSAARARTTTPVARASANSACRVAGSRGHRGAAVDRPRCARRGHPDRRDGQLSPTAPVGAWRRRRGTTTPCWRRRLPCGPARGPRVMQGKGLLW